MAVNLRPDENLRSALASKVPQVTVMFWLIKILATTVGETGGDAVSMTLKLGYAVASLTLLPHGLIGVMLAAMFSATMANLSAQFNFKSAILTKDVYQSLFRKNAGEQELLRVGWATTLLIGGATILVATIMAVSGQSVFQIMLKFNTLISLSYGPPALLGLVVRRTPPW